MSRKRPRTASSTDVTVTRVYDGSTYARVNSIGRDGERAFVLVPGIGVSSSYFERLAPILNEFGPVHALDLPGFGGVPHPGAALSIEGYADLLGKVLDQLGLHDPVIVGHSMGTQIVADLASRRPGISTIVLIGPVVNAAERRIGRQALRFAQSAWHETLRVKVLAVSGYIFCGPKWFSRVLPEMMRFAIEDRLPKVTAHTLVIRGEYDAVSPRDWVDRVGELLPSSRLWEMPGAAHSVMHAQAEEVARLCVDHVRQPPGDDDRLRHFPEHALDPGDDSLTLGQAVRATRARVTETIGILTDDDEKLERGKTAHAEALQEPREN
jgi:pimeloyl-ACP methyl ester carboxylesterase